MKQGGGDSKNGIESHTSRKEGHKDRPGEDARAQSESEAPTDTEAPKCAWAETAITISEERDRRGKS